MMFAQIRGTKNENVVNLGGRSSKTISEWCGHDVDRYLSS